jgi:hypothetical protein
MCGMGLSKSPNQRSNNVGTIKKNWVWILGAVFLAGALFIGGFVLGRSAGSADYASALAKYDSLKSADDALMGQLGTSLGNALTESQRLSAAGSGLEQSARAVAVLASGLHDSISAIVSYEKARGSSGPGNVPSGPK